VVLRVEELIQYWTSSRLPRGFRSVAFHAVKPQHTKTLDWMAGSRCTVRGCFFTRSPFLGPLYVLCLLQGPRRDIYVIVVGFQAVFNPPTVSLPWGPLKYMIVTTEHSTHASTARTRRRGNALRAQTRLHSTRLWSQWQGQQRSPKSTAVLGRLHAQGSTLQQTVPFTGAKKRRVGGVYRRRRRICYTARGRPAVRMR